MKRLILFFSTVLISLNTHSQVISNYYGVFTDNPNIVTRLTIDGMRGHVYVWEQTLSGLITDPYEGEGCLAFRSTGVGWWGFGIHDDSAISLTHFNNGYLIFSVKTTAKEEFSVNIYGANKTEAKITFARNGGPQNFKRNGLWHKISYPISDLIEQGLDLSAVSIPFAAIGSTISNIAFDDIFYSIDDRGPINPVALPQPEPDTTASPTNITIQQNNSGLIYANGQLIINALNPILKITVTDITGKTVYNTNTNKAVYNLNISNFTKGIYIVSAYKSDGKIMRKKILVK